MNKSTLPALGLGLGAAAATAAAATCGGIYLRIFDKPHGPQDPYRLLQGSQYEQYSERTLALVRAFDALPYEPVTIRSFDGLRLFGRYYHVRDGAPVQLMMHGYRGVALRDFCGGNEAATALGHNRLLIDQRAHGRSEGRSISFGVLERQDCLSWARYLDRRFGGNAPILLSGVSMGAATVLMASELALPASVRGVIADCPYTSPRAIIRRVCLDTSPALEPLLPLVKPTARLFAGFDLDGASALEAVGRTSLPVLLIHGEADGFVPCDMSRELAAACAGPVRLETFPGADHGMSYMLDSPRYVRVLEEFLASLGL